jgi:hypothetical protein
MGLFLLRLNMLMVYFDGPVCYLAKLFPLLWCPQKNFLLTKAINSALKMLSGT